jgi:hypothetical protein
MGKSLALFALILVLGAVITSGCIGDGTHDGELSFIAPEQLLEGTVGEPYPSYSFCDPDSARSGATCGGLVGETMNPMGGRPPYSFTHEFGTGFLPPGLTLELNGLLSGTPTTPGTYTFGVCANDGSSESCQTMTVIINSKEEELPPNPPDNFPGEPDIGDGNTVQPKTGAVTVDSTQCTLIEDYDKLAQGTLCRLGAKYARVYEIKAEGSMSGPEGSEFTLSTLPFVGGSSDWQLSCGGWLKAGDTCYREAGSADQPQKWSFTTQAFGEQVGVDPNLQVAITGTVTIDGRVVQSTRSVTCTQVDYCLLVE